MSNKLELSGIQQNVIRELGSLFTVNRWGSPVKGGVAKTYREMNAAASEIAFKEAKVYFLAYSKERTFARLKAGIRARAKTKEKKSVEEDQESKLATTVFLDYFNQRKAHHMTQMFRILEATREPNESGGSDQHTTKQEGGDIWNGSRPNSQNGSGTAEGARADGPGIPEPGRPNPGP